MRTSALATVTLLLLVPSSAAFSQKGAEQAKSSYIDFAPPDLSGFGLLGVNSSKVSRPGNLKELAVAFLSSPQTLGKIASGIAVEWTPFQTYGSGTFEEYKQNPCRRLQLSFATAQDSQATKVAVGIRWVPIDNSDPLLDSDLQEKVLQCLRLLDDTKNSAANRRSFLMDVIKFFSNRKVLPEQNELSRIVNVFDPLAAPKPPNKAGLLDSLKAQMKQDWTHLDQDQMNAIDAFASEYVSIASAPDKVNDVDKMVKLAKADFMKNNWNRSVVQVSLGVTAASANSTWQELASENFACFAGGAFKLGTYGQWILQLQGSTSMRSSSNDKSMYSLGTRLVLGGSDVRGCAEGLYSVNDRKKAQPDDKDMRYTLGLEIKLAEGVWLEVAGGGEFAQADASKSGILALANFKYALQPTSPFSK